MTMKEKIIEVLEGSKLTIRDITREINKKYQINTTEARIRSYIKRLKDDNVIEKVGIDNRYKVYKLKKDSVSTETLTDKLLLLMIKAGINSEEYGVDIKESEIESNMKRLMERGKIG